MFSEWLWHYIQTILSVSCHIYEKLKYSQRYMLHQDEINRWEWNKSETFRDRTTAIMLGIHKSHFNIKLSLQKCNMEER